MAKAQHLVSILKEKGTEKPFNMDRTLLHLAADVIGTSLLKEYISTKEEL